MQSIVLEYYIIMRKNTNYYNLPMRLTTLILFVLFLPLFLLGQSEDAKRYAEEYEKNIQKSQIDGIYIPKDMADAFIELDRLTSRENKAKFISLNEKEASKRLFFSLGRWITIKWQFYEGSRFSHYLKTAGLKHPDDMTFFVMIMYHRHLTKAPLDVKNLIDQLNDKTFFSEENKTDQ